MKRLFNLIKDDFDENIDAIMNSINKILENDTENKEKEVKKEEKK